MRLAMRVPGRTPDAQRIANDRADIDPREVLEAEVIDLAQRNAFPAVTQRSARSDGLGLVAGVALVAGLGAVTLWGMNTARLAPAQGVGGQGAAVAPPVVPPQAVTQLGAVPAGATPPGAVGLGAVPVGATPLGDPAPAPVYAAPPSAAVSAAPAMNRYASPTVVFDASGAVIPGGVVTPGEGGESGAATGNSASDFASRVGGVGGAPAQARAMVNPSTTVTQGTLIPAVLETAIDTNVPGYVRAVVSQDVRSFDGTRVLVPRSSRLIGQYQSGLQGGQRRAYVIWQRLIRPDGVSVNLGSPAIGFDGTAGLEGKVTSNFFKRFGSAMMLSVVSGLGALASGGTSVIVSGAGNSAAASAAQQDGQIGPTVRVRQGEPIRIFTARDLDFSSVG